MAQAKTKLSRVARARQGGLSPGQFGAESLVSLEWNGWSVCSGISGQFAPEYAPHLCTAGRWRVHIIDTSGIPKIRSVHVLIWESVYGPVPKGYVIHHINFIRTDNRLENLQLMWGLDHLRLHYYVEKKALLEAGRKNSVDCWIKSRIRDGKGRFIRDWMPELKRRLAATF